MVHYLIRTCASCPCSPIYRHPIRTAPPPPYPTRSKVRAKTRQDPLQGKFNLAHSPQSSFFPFKKAKNKSKSSFLDSTPPLTFHVTRAYVARVTSKPRTRSIREKQCFYLSAGLLHPPPRPFFSAPCPIQSAVRCPRASFVRKAERC